MTELASRETKPDTVVRPFSEVTALVPEADDTFAAVIDPEWSIGGRANGGYLLALLGRAAALVVPDGHVVAASASYLRSPEAGPAEVRTQVLRSGRSTSQVRAALLQEGKAVVEALITVSRLRDDSVPFWDAGLPAIDTPPFEQTPRLLGPTPSGIRVALLEQVDVRIDPACLGFATGEPAGRGELWGWLALPHAESFDPLSLLFAVDALPPATFDIEMSGWVPTLTLSAYVRALPAPGPVRVLQKAGLIDGQRLDETCFVWDSRGRLVAQSTQLAAIRLG